MEHWDFNEQEIQARISQKRQVFMKNAEESLGLKSKDTLASSMKPSSDKVQEVNELLDDFSNVFDA